MAARNAFATLSGSPIPAARGNGEGGGLRCPELAGEDGPSSFLHGVGSGTREKVEGKKIKFLVCNQLNSIISLSFAGFL